MSMFMYFTVIILGYALQYLFLTTFAIMTCMSCELLMNLRYFLILKSICKLHTKRTQSYKSTYIS